MTATTTRGHLVPATATTDGLRIGMLGCGTVGSAVLRALADGPARAQVTRVGVRRPWVVRDCPLPPIVTDDVAAVLAAPDVDVIVEVIGGLDVAASAVRRALRSGTAVVTANKDLIADQGSALRRLAARHGASLRYEAAVLAGVPVIAPLQRLVRHDRVTKVEGILNGTANHVLTAMEEDGLDLEVAVARAQAAGFAEADPARDLDGRDAAAKLAVLAQTAWGSGVREQDVHRLGLVGLTLDDVRRARADGHRYRLVAVATPTCARVELRRLPVSHPLAQVRGADNAVSVHARSSGRLTFSGPGAGGAATAAGILADLDAIAAACGC